MKRFGEIFRMKEEKEGKKCAKVLNTVD